MDGCKKTMYWFKGIKEPRIVHVDYHMLKRGVSFLSYIFGIQYVQTCQMNQCKSYAICYGSNINMQSSLKL